MNRPPTRRTLSLALLLASGSAGAGLLCHRADRVTLPAGEPLGDLVVIGARDTELFSRLELEVTLPPALAALPDSQIHDAYDADRDGRYLRLDARFRHESGDDVLVPGFALREEPGGPWQWRVRWAPRKTGRWSAEITVLAGLPGRSIQLHHEIAEPISVAASGRAGPLVSPEPGASSAYLRELQADGTSRATWLFGACRAWVVGAGEASGDPHRWASQAWLDRETELLGPMRRAGFNLLNQWMAPWEYLLVHRDRAELWRRPDGGWQRVPLEARTEWTPHQAYDQGRARAFDDLVEQCQGGRDQPIVHLLLSPLPHQVFQMREHPWGANESGWSPENDRGHQSPDRLNGFSGFLPQMSVWSFFEASPDYPLSDWHSRLFDAQAGFLRYLVARWGYSSAVGAWVLIDELDAVGDVVGNMRRRTGWWAHPECDRWLDAMTRLLHGELRRADGMRYAGDPYRHPVHAATTSNGDGFARGDNLDWSGPRPGAIDLLGWHFYPRLGAPSVQDWTAVVEGVTAYANAPSGDRARLISEFGAPDREGPTDLPSLHYPAIFHFAIWAGIFAGLAGTPMDWDDGEHFGELRWRSRPGAFDQEHYPIDLGAHVSALRAFLRGLHPDALVPCASADASPAVIAEGGARVLALCARTGQASIHGWLFAPTPGAQLTVRGLARGEHELVWIDPWTGDRVPEVSPERLRVSTDAPLRVDASAVLAKLRARSAALPERERMARGLDVAFTLRPAAE